MPEPSPPALLVRILNKWQMLLAQNSFTKEQTKRKNWRDSTTDSPATLSVFRNCIHKLSIIMYSDCYAPWILNHTSWSTIYGSMDQMLAINDKYHFWIYERILNAKTKSSRPNLTNWNRAVHPTWPKSTKKNSAVFAKWLTNSPMNVPKLKCSEITTPTNPNNGTKNTMKNL